MKTRSGLKKLVMMGVLLAGMFLMLTLTSSRVYAGGVVGNGTPGSCTEAAFDAALAGGGTVTFNCGGAHTIVIFKTKTISADTLIDGNGLITLRGGTNLIGDKNVNVFLVEYGKVLFLYNMTIRDAKTALNNYGTAFLDGVQFDTNITNGDGGAIYNLGLLDAQNSVFMNNQAGRGGAIYNFGQLHLYSSSFANNQAQQGGAIFTDYYVIPHPAGVEAANLVSDLLIAGSTLSGNHATDGGALYHSGDGVANMSNTVFDANSATASGGAIFNAGTMGLDRTTVMNNTATTGGGIENTGALDILASTIKTNHAQFGGGIDHGNNQTLKVERSTISSNEATVRGGGIQSFWDATLVNSTISGNTGIGYFQGGGQTIMTNVTVANNTGYGIYADSESNGVSVKNTLLSANNGGNCFHGGYYGTYSLGHNLSSDSTCAFFTEPGDQTNVNAKLGALANNGGLTLTHLPQTGSPAINGGDNNGCPATDQRGVTRPKGGTCDIGAVEVDAATPTPTRTRTLTQTATRTATATRTVTRTPTRTATRSATPTRTVTPGNPPAQPKLLSPENGAVVTVQQVPLDWKNAARADSYKVRVKDRATGKLADKKNNWQSLNYTTKTLAQGKTFKWFVFACTDDGVCTRSAKRTFTVQ